MAWNFFPINLIFKPPVLGKQWREINWRDNQKDLEYVKNYKPQIEGQQLRILLHGQVGSGKSSFINSVQSVLLGRIYMQAFADNTGGPSYTQKYKTYKVRKDKDTSYPFVFSDIMGLEPSDQGGANVDDVKLALKGHMKDGYPLNPLSKLSEENQFYKKSPEPNDKVHVLVLVVSAKTYPIKRDEIVRKFREIRNTTNELEIPQIAVLTSPDQAYPEIREDLKNIYKVQPMKKMMEQLSVDVGIPMNCIFPVKNYDEEIDLNSNIDSLILSVMRRIIDCGDDHLNFLKDRSM